MFLPNTFFGKYPLGDDPSRPFGGYQLVVSDKYDSDEPDDCGHGVHPCCFLRWRARRDTKPPCEEAYIMRDGKPRDAGR